MNLSSKDPVEIITVTFDFSDLATAVNSPVVSVIVLNGKIDPAADDMRIGDPQTDGTKVLQRIGGGLDGNTYKLRCEVDDADGERWVISDALLVQTS